MQIFDGVLQDLMKSYVKYPPLKQQSLTYSGPITLQQYERFTLHPEMLEKEGTSFTHPPNGDWLRPHNVYLLQWGRRRDQGQALRHRAKGRD